MPAVLLLWWVALGQTPADSHIEPVPPPGERPLIFEMKQGFTTRDGRTRVVGYVDNPNWASARSVLIKLDEPWSERAQITVNTAEILGAIPEEEGEWRTRHLAGWESAGYVNVGTGETLYFVPSTEAERARTAQALVAKQAADMSAIPADPVATSDNSAPPAGDGPGWTKHIAVTLLGLVLAAIVIKTLVLQ